MPEPRTFTVMCQDASGTGTIWIDTLELGPTDEGTYPLDIIKETAVKYCASEWDCEENDLVCMGVILGQVNFLYFDDSHLGD